VLLIFLAILHPSMLLPVPRPRLRGAAAALSVLPLPLQYGFVTVEQFLKGGCDEKRIALLFNSATP